MTLHYENEEYVIDNLVPKFYMELHLLKRLLLMLSMFMKVL